VLQGNGARGILKPTADAKEVSAQLMSIHNKGAFFFSSVEG